MTLEAHETLLDHIALPETSRAEQRQQRTPFFFRPSLPPDPLTPRRRPAFWPSKVRRAQKQFPSRHFMAVNHADGTIFSSLVICPIAAWKGAVSGGAGWFSILFLPAGFAVGIILWNLGRAIIYSIVEFGLARAGKIRKGWIQQIVSAPFLLLYLVLPYAVLGVGVYGSWLGSMWLSKRIW